MVTQLGQHAVVIGGSLGGLMTARVLADHFEAVTVLERDHIDTRPALHQSIPHGNHLHVLLFGGQQVMASLYLGFIDKLERLGGVRLRVGKDVVYYMPDGKAYTRGGSVREPRDLGFDIHAQSRGLLEYCVRQCTLAQTHVQLQSDCLVHGLMLEEGRVHGSATPKVVTLSKYLAALDALTAEDVELQRLLFEVFHLAKPRSLLNEVPLRRRVFAQQR